MGRYYFSYGSHLDSNKPEDLSPVSDFILRNSLLVCWLFSFVKPLHLDNFHTLPSSFGWMCYDFWVEKLQPRKKEKKPGKQFPSLTEVSFDSLNSFPSLILYNNGGSFVCLYVPDKMKRGQQLYCRILYWGWRILSPFRVEYRRERKEVLSRVNSEEFQNSGVYSRTGSWIIGIKLPVKIWNLRRILIK